MYFPILRLSEIAGNYKHVHSFSFTFDLIKMWFNCIGRIFFFFFALEKVTQFYVELISCDHL